jgi:quinol monooxygenase YgiN
MQLDTIVRFHAREGQEGVIAMAMREAAAQVRAEPGCLGIEYFRSTRDALLFYIHSRWRDEAAFELHAELPHTLRFLDLVRPAIDHDLFVARVEKLNY